MNLTFFGAAREVTGSCYRVETDGLRFLVDCGMFQGGRQAEENNRRAPLFDPREIDFVLLTHAHIDHSGLLPRLVAMGFKGPIYCTAPTADLLEVMLLDSAHLQEKEAEWETRHRRRRRGGRVHVRDIAPLYTVAQAQASLKHVRGLEYDHPLHPHPRVRVCFRDAGHILGSAIIEVWVEESGQTVKLVFSGDLGQPDRPLVQDPTPIERADILLIESTYGNRLHKPLEATRQELAQAVNDTLLRKRGNLIVPAFALGRTQELLYMLHELAEAGRIPAHLDVYVDSPMATAATHITLKHLNVLDVDADRLLRAKGKGPRVHFTETVEESMALNSLREGAIIIAASGMCEGGRIRHHLRHNLPDRACTILIAGFQAAGTLGRRLVDGAKEVTLFGERVPVRADLYTLGGLSAHADRDALLGWLARFREAPRQTFIVHGEAATALGFGEQVRERFGWRVETPELGSTYTL
ncbi:MAG: MBL fold metallo-hydrolase RNA specificity domain-containing protein [Pseudomonadota bacterium]